MVPRSRRNSRRLENLKIDLDPEKWTAHVRVWSCPTRRWTCPFATIRRFAVRCARGCWPARRRATAEPPQCKRLATTLIVRPMMIAPKRNDTRACRSATHADSSRHEGRVGDLECQPNDERDVGEVEIVRPLVGMEVDPVTVARAVVLPPVAQREDRVHAGKGERNAQH